MARTRTAVLNLGRSVLAVLVIVGIPDAAAGEPVTCNPCQITRGHVGHGLDTMPGPTFYGPEFPGLNLEHWTLTLSDWFDWRPGEPLDVTLAGSV